MSLAKRSKNKTEHTGAKNGGGHWGTRAEAKAISKKHRRENSKSEIVQETKDFEVDGNGSIPWRLSVQALIHENTEPGVMLKGSRTKEGLSQTELASMLGIPPSNISEMEHGKRPIGKNMAKRLSKVLKVDFRVFL